MDIPYDLAVRLGQVANSIFSVFWGVGGQPKAITKTASKRMAQPK